MAANTSTRPVEPASSVAEPAARGPDERRPADAEGSRRTAITRKAVVVLAVLATLYTLYFARPILVPMVVSLLLAALLAPIVTALTRLRIPRWLGSAVVVLAVLGVVAAGAHLLQGPVDRWLEEAPRALARAEDRLREILAPVEQVGEAAEQVEQIAAGDDAGQSVQVDGDGGFKATVFAHARSGVTGAVIVLGLVYFLLSWGHLFMMKLARAVSTAERRRVAWDLALNVERDVSTYLLTVTGINVLLGAAVTGAMALVGMPSPLLWGVLAAVLNFIPYFGAVVGMAVLALVGFAVFEDPGRAILMVLVDVGLTGVEGNVLKPMILGKRLRLNPVAVFVGLLFRGWIWGVVGAILAVPLLSALKLWADHYEPLAPVASFLGR